MVPVTISPHNDIDKVTINGSACIDPVCTVDMGHNDNDTKVVFD
jgi:hypothetical protein